MEKKYRDTLESRKKLQKKISDLTHTYHLLYEEPTKEEDDSYLYGFNERKKDNNKELKK